MTDDLDDDEIEAIHEAAQESAIHAWRGNIPANPYPSGSDRADIWDYAFRNEFARQNGY